MAWVEVDCLWNLAWISRSHNGMLYPIGCRNVNVYLTSMFYFSQKKVFSRLLNCYNFLLRYLVLYGLLFINMKNPAFLMLEAMGRDETVRRRPSTLLTSVFTDLFITPKQRIWWNCVLDFPALKLNVLRNQ